LDPQQSATDSTPPQVTAAAMLVAIEHVAGLCEQLLKKQDDTTVAYMLQELKLISAAVTQAWPLPPGLKNRINLGPYAAKNIDDWNEPLATALMTLHDALQNDGAGLKRLGPR
jgi:hypothetical protein